MPQTSNYDEFKKISGNRNIYESHVLELMGSIQSNNLLEANPIIVNEKMEILDGQHRLEAAQRLNLPIFYVISSNSSIEDVGRLNSIQKNWKLDNFLNIFSDECKYPAYIKLKEWLKENKFKLAQGLSFFIEEGEVGNFRKNFKKGLFEFSPKTAQYSSLYRTVIEKITSMKGGVSRPWRQQSFVRAFLLFIQNPQIDKDRFIEQLNKYSFLVNEMPQKQLYLEMFYNLYNYNRNKRVNP